MLTAIRDETDELLDFALQAGESIDFDTVDFGVFCEKYLVIQDKNGAIVPLQLNAVQRDLINNLTGRDLVLKARQKGVTTVIQAWMLYQSLRGGARTSTLCHEDALTQDIRDMADRYYDNLPDESRPRRKYANATVTTYPDLNSRARIATVGGHAGDNSTGKKKGRGGTNTHIHGTEVAFWPDAEGVMSGAMQTGNPFIIIESTPNGMVGWFYEQCSAALDGASQWTLHFYPWFFDEEYQLPLDPGEVLHYTAAEQALVDQHRLSPQQIKWRRAKQAELPHTFLQEYPEDSRTCFLASGVGYFRDVEHVYTAPLEVQPDPSHRYFGGLDFAQTSDYTVLTIIDSLTLHMVDFLRINRLEWQEMRRQVSVMANKWNAVVYGEENSMGKTNIELLQSGEIMKDGTLIQPVNLTPFTTTSSSKPGLIQGLYHALHEAGLRLQNHGVLKQEIRAFISKQLPSGAWSYEAKSGHDDCVISLALAWYAAQFGGQRPFDFL